MNAKAALRTLPALILALSLLTVAVAGPGLSADLARETRHRREALGSQIDEGTLVLFGPSDPGVRSEARDPDFFYLTGLTEPGAALVVTVRRPESSARAARAFALADAIEADAGALRTLLRRTPRVALWTELTPLLKAAGRTARRARNEFAAERGPTLVESRLYLRRRSPARERWMGPALHPGPEATRATGMMARPVDRLVPDLEELPEGARLYLLEPGADRPQSLAPLLERRADLELRPAREFLARLRVLKSPLEVGLIREACRLTAAGLGECLRAARPGMAEYELQALLEYVCRRGGAPRQAFASIVASGPNATILHYRRNDRTVRDGDLVLMDVGAEFRGYAADITRTFPVNGRFTEEQARIYDVVLEAQRAAIAAVRPGVGLAKVNAAARAVFAQAGLLEGWRHAVSHHVGLDVHDPATPGPLRPGMVITVEPGLYFPEEGIGIRIEDTVVVTEDGCEVLSAGIVKERAEIEAMMAEDPLRATRGK